MTKRKFKIGDRVRLARVPRLVTLMLASHPTNGQEGIVVQLGGQSGSNEGVVVTNESWGRGSSTYPGNSLWFAEEDLDLIERGE